MRQLAIWIRNLLAVLVLTACATENRSLENVISIPVNDEAIIENENLSNLIIIRDVITLQTKDECLIGYIDKVKLHENNWYILDSRSGRSVFVFSKDGKFIRRIGKIGKGPGEYQFPSDFAIDSSSGSIYILSENQKKVIVFDKDGQYCREFSNMFLASNIEIQNEELVFVGQDLFQLHITDRNGVLENELFHNKYMVPILKPLSSWNNQTLFTTFLNDTLFRIANSKAIPSYYLDYEDHRLSEHVYMNSEFLNMKSQIIRRIDDSFMAPTFRLAETNDYLRFCVNYNRGALLIVYNKVSDRSKIINLKTLEDDIFFKSFVQTPFPCNINSWIGYINPHIIQKESITLMDRELKIDKYSNPILVVYDYKE